jgi:hypothetical protein
MEAGKKKQTTTMAVALTGVVHVPLVSSVLLSLGEFGMEQEIACEAVKISISDRLGGFEDMTVHPASSASRGGRPGGPKPSFEASINFDALSACLTKLVNEHDRMASACSQIAEALGRVDLTKWADPAYSAKVLADLSTIAHEATSTQDSLVGPPTEDRPMRDEQEEWVETNDDGDDDDDDNDCDNGRSAKEMGYQRLLDEREEADEASAQTKKCYLDTGDDEGAQDAENDGGPNE